MSRLFAEKVPCAGDFFCDTPQSRDGFEPDFCGLGPGRVSEMRARVGSGLTMRAAGRVGPVHLRAFSSFLLFFQTFLYNLWLFGVDLLPSKMKSVFIKKFLPKNVTKYVGKYVFSVKI